MHGRFVLGIGRREVLDCLPDHLVGAQRLETIGVAVLLLRPKRVVVVVGVVVVVVVGVGSVLGSGSGRAVGATEAGQTEMRKMGSLHVSSMPTRLRSRITG